LGGGEKKDTLIHNRKKKEGEKEEFVRKKKGPNGRRGKKLEFRGEKVKNFKKIHIKSTKVIPLLRRKKKLATGGGESFKGGKKEGNAYLAIRWEKKGKKS